MPKNHATKNPRKPIGRGAEAQVFWKKDLRPRSTRKAFSHYRGEVVKKFYIARNPKWMFYQNKIIRLLFPDNVPHIAHVDNQKLEIHMNYVPLNQELQEYCNKANEEGFLQYQGPEYDAHREAVRRTPKVAEVADKMRSAGIDSGLYKENFTNVSIANPDKPVFFEAYIINAALLEKYVSSSGVLSREQRARMLGWLQKLRQV